MGARARDHSGFVRIMRAFFYLLLFFDSLLLGGVFCGCGSATENPINPGSVTLASTACSDSNVAVRVGDGFMQILCGCTAANENPGTLIFAPTVLKCHLPSQTKMVFFHFPGTVLKHQIVSTGPNYFGPTALSDPSSSSVMRSSAVSIPSVSGTYEFQDIFNGAIGQFIVPKTSELLPSHKKKF